MTDKLQQRQTHDIHSQGARFDALIQDALPSAPPRIIHALLAPYSRTEKDTKKLLERWPEDPASVKLREAYRQGNDEVRRIAHERLGAIGLRVDLEKYHDAEILSEAEGGQGIRFKKNDHSLTTWSEAEAEVINQYVNQGGKFDLPKEVGKPLKQMMKEGASRSEVLAFLETRAKDSVQVGQLHSALQAAHAAPMPDRSKPLPAWLNPGSAKDNAGASKIDTAASDRTVLKSRLSVSSGLWPNEDRRILLSLVDKNVPEAMLSKIATASPQARGEALRILDRDPKALEKADLRLSAKEDDANAAKYLKETAAKKTLTAPGGTVYNDIGSRDDVLNGTIKRMQSGDAGEAVRWAQERLSVHGFRCKRDTFFKGEVEKCVRDFRKAKNLPDSGIIDEAVIASLKEPPARSAANGTTPPAKKSEPPAEKDSTRTDKTSNPGDGITIKSEKAAPPSADRKSTRLALLNWIGEEAKTQHRGADQYTAKMLEAYVGGAENLDDSARVYKNAGPDAKKRIEQLLDHPDFSKLHWTTRRALIYQGNVDVLNKMMREPGLRDLPDLLYVDLKPGSNSKPTFVMPKVRYIEDASARTHIEGWARQPWFKEGLNDGAKAALMYEPFYEANSVLPRSVETQTRLREELQRNPPVVYFRLKP